MKHHLRSIFGLNHRNRELVARYNTPPMIALASDKIACKARLTASGVATPACIAELRTTRDLPAIYTVLERQVNGFVVKPARGAQGNAVALYTHALPDRVHPQHGQPISRKDFAFSLAAILSGEFSAGRPSDAVLIEERIIPDRSWILEGVPGAPDLRVIVFQGTPIMAMARIPTVASEGRANLHRGGIGLGIDLVSGRSTHAVWQDRIASHHPDTGAELAGRFVDGLDECLALARRCFDAVPLGYMGVDIMLDRHRGPLVIELNARPGLAIQIANLKGLGEVLGGNEHCLGRPMASPAAEPAFPGNNP